ncbi:MAG: TfoX/Sxy family DNA transformation protein [Austwickia sp.]|nr:MAG: TfoX/Sxy family DNA transformation protein [Austwickia sp.]
MTASSSTPLESLPNIGPALAEALRDVGIGDAETLRAVGALAAWDDLYAAGRFHCLTSLMSVAAAVDGVPKRVLDERTRTVLRRHHERRAQT